MEKLTLIKVGGKIVEEEETLRSLLNDFSMLLFFLILYNANKDTFQNIFIQI